MNASKFMDKQIMDLSRSKTSHSNDEFLDLMNPIPANDEDCNTEENATESAGVTKKEGIFPNYDFQPIRPTGVISRPSDSSPMGGGSGGSGAVNAWNSSDLKPNSSASRSYGYMGSMEPDKVVLEKAHSVSDAAILSEIDCTMKKHTDNILHAIEGLSAHLSQLESRTRQLEYTVDDLKVSIGNNHGGTDGKMRQLENILRELQSCVVDLKDKQDVMNAQTQLEKLQTSEVDQSPETHKIAQINPPQQTAPLPQQFPPSLSPNAPQQNINPPMPLPSQYPPTPMPAVPQQDTYYPPAGQAPPSQQYSAPPPPPTQLQQPQALPPPPPVQHHQYQPGPPTPYPHGPHQYQQQQQQQPSPAINTPQPPQLQLPSGPPPSQQFYNTPPSHMYDSPTGGRSGSGSGSGFSSSVYNPPTEPLPYSGSSSQHYSNSNPGTKYPSLSSASSYPQLPTARVLPQAAAPISSGPSSGGGGNRVPIDDVIDKVTNMGFSREQVKGTVRKLTENSQPVDLNIVLDKLMNDGDVQQPRGWFGR